MRFIPLSRLELQQDPSRSIQILRRLRWSFSGDWGVEVPQKCAWNVLSAKSVTESRFSPSISMSSSYLTNEKARKNTPRDSLWLQCVICRQLTCTRTPPSARSLTLPLVASLSDFTSDSRRGYLNGLVHTARESPSGRVRATNYCC